MKISEKNVKNTCEFIVATYRRRLKEEKVNTYAESYNKLAGISILLIGFNEKKHVDSAIETLKKAAQETTCH